MTKSVELLSDDYALLTSVKASLGDPVVAIGQRGRCRYCGNSRPASFRNVAHALPEAFGNKWVTSLDECDACNAKFGIFDDALTKSLGAILTIGGTPGKGNKVRQTGRSAGPAMIRHELVDGKRSISMRVSGAPLGDHVAINAVTGELTITTPVGQERHIPARAYKALVKMGVALLPSDELPQFSKVIEWLGAPDAELLPQMVAGLSVASLGNAPPLLSAALIRRKSDRIDLPYMVFLSSMGSICLQIFLAANERNGPWPPDLKARPSFEWTNVIEVPERPPLRLVYGRPIHLDLACSTLEPPIIEAIVTTVHPSTGQAGRMTAVIRQSARAGSRD